MDTSTYHYVSPVDFNDSELSKGKYATKFFYWTPDMPKIVVRQAQDIKRNCESTPWAKFMASEILVRHISEYRPVLHPVIYPLDVTVEFQTDKPSSKIVRAMDRWFWETASTQVQGNYLNAIEYIKQKTNSKHMVKGDISNGIAGHKTKFYKL
jgi:hypothetical protein